SPSAISPPGLALGAYVAMDGDLFHCAPPCDVGGQLRRPRHLWRCGVDVQPDELRATPRSLVSPDLWPFSGAGAGHDNAVPAIGVSASLFDRASTAPLARSLAVAGHDSLLDQFFGPNLRLDVHPEDGRADEPALNQPGGDDPTNRAALFRLGDPYRAGLWLRVVYGPAALRRDGATRLVSGRSGL